MNSNLTNNVLQYLQSILAFCKRYAVILCVSVFALACGYIITLTTSLGQSEPDQATINNQLKAIPRPKITKEVTDKIHSLESQNVEVRAIFKQARDNPFTE